MLHRNMRSGCRCNTASRRQSLFLAAGGGGGRGGRLLLSFIRRYYCTRTSVLSLSSLSSNYSGALPSSSSMQCRADSTAAPSAFQLSTAPLSPSCFSAASSPPPLLTTEGTAIPTDTHCAPGWSGGGGANVVEEGSGVEVTADDAPGIAEGVHAGQCDALAVGDVDGDEEFRGLGLVDAADGAYQPIVSPFLFTLNDWLCRSDASGGHHRNHLKHCDDGHLTNSSASLSSLCCLTDGMWDFTAGSDRFTPRAETSQQPSRRRGRSGGRRLVYPNAGGGGGGSNGVSSFPYTSAYNVSPSSACNADDGDAFALLDARKTQFFFHQQRKQQSFTLGSFLSSDTTTGGGSGSGSVPPPPPPPPMPSPSTFAVPFLQRMYLGRLEEDTVRRIAEGLRRRGDNSGREEGEYEGEVDGKHGHSTARGERCGMRDEGAVDGEQEQRLHQQRRADMFGFMYRMPTRGMLQHDDHITDVSVSAPPSSSASAPPLGDPPAAVFSSSSSSSSSPLAALLGYITKACDDSVVAVNADGMSEHDADGDGRGDGGGGVIGVVRRKLVWSLDSPSFCDGDGDGEGSVVSGGSVQQQLAALPCIALSVGDASGGSMSGRGEDHGCHDDEADDGDVWGSPWEGNVDAAADGTLPVCPTSAPTAAMLASFQRALLRIGGGGSGSSRDSGGDDTFIKMSPIGPIGCDDGLHHHERGAPCAAPSSAEITASAASATVMQQQWRVDLLPYPSSLIPLCSVKIVVYDKRKGGGEVSNWKC